MHKTWKLCSKLLKHSVCVRAASAQRSHLTQLVFVANKGSAVIAACRIEGNSGVQTHTGNALHQKQFYRESMIYISSLSHLALFPLAVCVCVCVVPHTTCLLYIIIIIGAFHLCALGAQSCLSSCLVLILYNGVSSPPSSPVSFTAITSSPVVTAPALPFSLSLGSSSSSSASFAGLSPSLSAAVTAISSFAS